MSQENVELFKRANAAANRGDIEGVLATCNPEVEWHAAIQALLGGEETTYWGHAGVREFYRDTFEAFSEFQAEYSEVRDLGDRVLAVGRVRVRGRHSEAEAESPVSLLIDVKDGKAIRLRSYLDPDEALDAAGLSE